MIAIDEAACPKNHPCPTIHACPAGAIVQDDIHSAPRIDQELCTDCGLCTKRCHAFVRTDRPVVAKVARV
jgi:Fe-S-cluster-containing hydrogenase component 2